MHFLEYDTIIFLNSTLFTFVLCTDDFGFVVFFF